MKSLRFVSSLCFFPSFAVLLIGLVAGNPAYAKSAPLIFLPAVDYYSGGENGISVAVADVNGDGKPDMVVASFCASASNCTGLFGPGGVSVLRTGGNVQLWWIQRQRRRDRGCERRRGTGCRGGEPVPEQQFLCRQRKRVVRQRQWHVSTPSQLQHRGLLFRVDRDR
jgi:hypothetical protein